MNHYEFKLPQDLERYTLVQHLLRQLLLPVLNYMLPERRLRAAIARLSDAGTQAVEKGGSTHSMASIYAAKEHGRSPLTRLRQYISHELISATKGTRNRMKIVRTALVSALAEPIARGELVHILTLGGGTCHAIIEAFDTVAPRPTSSAMRVTNIDIDATAIAAGRAHVQSKGYDACFTWVEDSAERLEQILGSSKVQVVEMIGLAEYLDDAALERIFVSVRRVLAPAGIFIVGNVRPTREARFYRRIGWPQMYYRTKKQLEQLLTHAGFPSPNITMIAEPVGLHHIALVRA